MTITAGQPRTRRPRRRPGPDDHGRSGSGLSPVVGDDGHLAARPAQPAGQDNSSAHRGHHHQGRTSLGQLGHQRSGVRGWRQAHDHRAVDRERRHQGGRRRWRGGTMGRDRENGHRAPGRWRWRAGPGAGRPSARPPRRPGRPGPVPDPNPGPWRWPGAAARETASTFRGRPPSRRPAVRPGRLAPASRSPRLGPGAPAPGSRTLCRRRPHR